MQKFLTDLRLALRNLLAAPMFTIAAVLTLALGIGGTTAIFSLMDSVMLRSLPVSDPSRLYRVGDGNDCCVEGGPQDRWGMYSYPLFERLKREMPEFEEVTAFQAGGARLSVRREGSSAAARALRSEYVTGNYFSTLGVRAFAGRTLTASDDTPASSPAVVLSHHAWQTAYGADPGVVGSTLVIEGYPFTVAGIAPPGFFGETLRGDPPDLWIPVHQEPRINGGASLLRESVPAWLRVIGRLRPGASVEEMGPRLTGVLRQWIQHDSGYPANWMPDIMRALSNQVITVVPAGAGVAVMKEEYGRSLQILFGVCGLVLLIACANVANLLLARSVARRRQTAVRLALGASRGEIVKDGLIESVVLALAGGFVGLLVAAAAARLLLALAFSSATFLPISTQPSFTVLAFAFALSLLTAVLFGAVPGWLATRTDPVDVLRGTGRGTTDKSSFAQKALLVVQATLSVVLVAGAMMLSRSLSNLENQNFGFEVEGRAVARLNRPPSSYTVPQLTALYRRVEERLNRLPGVSGSGLALYNPLTDNWGELVLVQGHPAPKPEEGGASWDRVSASYLQNFGIGLVRGRFFTEADDAHAAPVALVNEAFVKRFFKSGEDPLEQHFGLDLPENAGTFRIVGIVRNAKFAGFNLHRPARPMFYVPLAQNVDYRHDVMQKIELASHFVQALMLRTDMRPSVLEPLLTKALAEVDPNLTLTSVRTMRQQVELTFEQERAVARLAGLFGLVALLLAAVGLYGVTAYTVAQRTSEIGIRMALGASPGTVLGLVVRGAFRRVLAGLVLGVPLAIGAGRLIGAQLYNVSFWDPRALTIATVALVGCSLLASVIPAMRAASISPMGALRME